MDLKSYNISNVDRRESNTPSLKVNHNNSNNHNGLYTNNANNSSNTNLNNLNGLANHNNGTISSSNRNASISGMSGGRRRASMFDPIDPAELQKTLYQNV